METKERRTSSVGRWVIHEGEVKVVADQIAGELQRLGVGTAWFKSLGEDTARRYLRDWIAPMLSHESRRIIAANNASAEIVEELSDARAEDDAVHLAAQARDAARLVAYVVENEIFDEPCPSSCGGCGHKDCRENEREWAEMRALSNRVRARFLAERVQRGEQP